MNFTSESLVRLYCWAKEETAQTMTEYALILGILSVAAVAIAILLGGQIGAAITRVTAIFDAA
jgi:Flp pilus assembly pilin Flp